MKPRWTINQLLARPIHKIGRAQSIGIGQTFTEFEEMPFLQLEPQSVREQILRKAASDGNIRTAVWDGDKCLGVESPTTWKIQRDDQGNNFVVGTANCCPSSESNPRDELSGCVSKEVARYVLPKK